MPFLSQRSMLETLRFAVLMAAEYVLWRKKGSHMSFRNGHRSRENVLRRARILRRLKTRQLRESLAKQAAAKPAAK